LNLEDPPAQGHPFRHSWASDPVLAPVRGGIVTARARVAAVKGEERTYSAEVNVEDEGGARVAVFSSTFRVARGSAQK